MALRFLNGDLLCWCGFPKIYGVVSVGWYATFGGSPLAEISRQVFTRNTTRDGVQDTAFRAVFKCLSSLLSDSLEIPDSAAGATESHPERRAPEIAPR